MRIVGSDQDMTATVRWFDKDGQALSCKDKLATLEDNLEELLEVALEALEDAAVMGVDTEAARKIFVDEIASLKPRFTNQNSDSAGTVAPSNRSES